MPGSMSFDIPFDQELGLDLKMLDPATGEEKEFDTVVATVDNPDFYVVQDDVDPKDVWIGSTVRDATGKLSGTGTSADGTTGTDTATLKSTAAGSPGAAWSLARFRPKTR